jgi:hypothetical protein
MNFSNRFNFSPIVSLPTSDFQARATRRLVLGLSARNVHSGTGSATAVSSAPSAPRTLWDHSVLDRLQAPLTRYHD